MLLNVFLNAKILPQNNARWSTIPMKFKSDWLPTMPPLPNMCSQLGDTVKLGGKTLRYPTPTLNPKPNHVPMCSR